MLHIIRPRLYQECLQIKIEEVDHDKRRYTIKHSLTHSLKVKKIFIILCYIKSYGKRKLVLKGRAVDRRVLPNFLAGQPL